jgi:hypothetical protein
MMSGPPEYGVLLRGEEALPVAEWLAPQPSAHEILFDQSADFRPIPYLAGQDHDVHAVSREHPAD